MGRGPRQHAEGLTAHNLLFGPRRPRPGEVIDGLAGQERVDEIVARMKESGDYQEALKLLVRYNDQGNANLKHLAEEMHDPIVRRCYPNEDGERLVYGDDSQASDWHNLCQTIAEQIKLDGNIPALDYLSHTIRHCARGWIDVSWNTPGANSIYPEELNLLSQDHPLSAALRGDLAANHGVATMLDYGTDPGRLWVKPSDEEAYQLRRSAYDYLSRVGYDLSDIEDRDVIHRGLGHWRVAHDINQGRADDLFDHMQRLYWAAGPASFWGDDHFGADCARNLAAHLNHGRRSRMINAIDHFTNVAVSGARQNTKMLAESVGVSIDQEPGELLDERGRLMHSFGRAYVDGQSDKAVRRYHRKVAETLVKEGVAKSLLKSPLLEKSKEWQSFDQGVLARPFPWPNRRVYLSDDQAKELLASSFTSYKGDPFLIQIDEHKLIRGLKEIHFSQ